jgi:hypothetical protein
MGFWSKKSTAFFLLYEGWWKLMKVDEHTICISYNISFSYRYVCLSTLIYVGFLHFLYIICCGVLLAGTRLLISIQSMEKIARAISPGKWTCFMCT